jgi:hypothetical protein
MQDVEMTIPAYNTMISSKHIATTGVSSYGCERIMPQVSCKIF